MAIVLIPILLEEKEVKILLQFSTVSFNLTSFNQTESSLKNFFILKNFNEQMKFILQAEKEATDRGYTEPDERYEYIQQRVDELLGDYPND